MYDMRITIFKVRLVFVELFTAHPCHFVRVWFHAHSTNHVSYTFTSMLTKNTNAN